MKGRPALSLACLGLASFLLLVGSLALYADRNLLNSERFADEAVAAIEQPEVRSALADEITRGAVEKIAPNLISARPLIESATDGLLATDAFQALFRQAAIAAHRALLDGGDGAVVTIANLGVMLEQTLRRFDPALAKKTPPGFDSTVLEISEGDFAAGAARVADDIRKAARLLPIAAILLLGAAVWIAVNRRRAIIRAGFVVAIVGVGLIAIEVIGRELVGALSDDASDHAAALSIWDSFVGSLRWWGLALAIAGGVVISAGATALAAYSLDERLLRLWRRLVREPETTGWRLIWAAGAAALGLLFVLEPTAMLTLAATLAGVTLLARATGAAIEVLLGRFGAAEAKAGGGKWLGQERRVMIGFTLSSIVAVAGVAAVIGIILGNDDSARAKPSESGCNGTTKLCGKRLDRVTIAATHNSYAGADYPGFVFPEQDGTISEQLEAGVRGLWIDTYYGIPGDRVYTDTEKINPALNATLQKELGPKFIASADRVRSRIAKPKGKPKLYFCHGYCELGAVDAVSGFEEIREFLEDNPDEVLIIDIEDYTTPDDTVAAIAEAGLDDYVYKGPTGPPWPTLEQMIDSGGRVLIVVEHQRGGPQWYRPAYERIFQETQYDFKKPSQMDCAPNRGKPGNSLFLINHWIDTDPAPRPTNAKKVNAYAFLLDRAKRCQRRRRAFPNVLNVDFYGEGDVFGVAKTLNR